MTPRAKSILAVDGGAALVVAIGMFMLREPLARFFGFEVGLVTGIAAMNALYSSYSGTLAIRAARGLPPSRRAIDLLIAGNLAWTVACVGIIAATWSHSTAFGVAQVAGEGLFVAALAFAERKWIRPLTA